MAVMKKGNFSIDIGFFKLGADFEESDRQCAWELYTELATRIAVTGKSKDPDCTDFSGEVYAESLTSLHTFFSEARKIMRQFPVGSINAKGIENHLGALIHRAMRDVLRPFLEAWQADYRFWWENTRGCSHLLKCVYILSFRRKTWIAECSPMTSGHA